MASMRPCEASSGTPAEFEFGAPATHSVDDERPRSRRNTLRCAMTDQSPIMRAVITLPDQRRRCASEPVAQPHGGADTDERPFAPLIFLEGRAHSRAHSSAGRSNARGRRYGIFGQPGSSS
jgi:hypothetical protein